MDEIIIHDLPERRSDHTNHIGFSFTRKNMKRSREAWIGIYQVLMDFDCMVH